MDDVYNVVYDHLLEMYTNVARNMYGLIPHDTKEFIKQEAYRELLRMERAGQVNDYYERIKNNAI